MSINSIGYFGTYNFCKNGNLSEETKQKLLALGIDPSVILSESQAQILIDNILKIQSINNTSKNSGANFCCSECELLSRAKQLARKIGIVISDNMKMEEILSIISAAINKKLTKPKQDEKTLITIKNCQEELFAIQSDFSTVKQNQNAMYASMNFNANFNKMMLGL